MTERVTLCRAADVAEGQAIGITAPVGVGNAESDRDGSTEAGETWILVRHAGRLHAYLDDCPHIPGAPLAWRKDAYLSGDRQHIVCHAHGARFDIPTGRCVLGPCEGQSLTAVPLHISADGEVQVDPAALALHSRTSP